MVTIITDIAFARRASSTLSRDSPFNPSERHSKVCLVVSLSPSLTILMCRTIKSLIKFIRCYCCNKCGKRTTLFEIWPVSHYLMVREAWVKGTAREILDNGVKVARDALKEVDCLDEAHKPILLQIGTAIVGC